MPGLNQRIAELLWIVSGAKPKHLVHEARTAHLPRLAHLTDGEFLDECGRMLGTAKLGTGEDPQRHRDTLGFRPSLGSRDAEALALGIEAFSRFPPASLPRNTRLSDEQILAAAHLMAGSLVQMDTGEGKTFALSTAAFALLRVYERVYIVTANEYLASRDAAQTWHFWQSVGVSVGLGQEYGGQDAEESWAADVVYTTLSALQFRSLDEDIGDFGRGRTIAWSAALLDEADAVLLEQSSGRHVMTRSTAPTTKDWGPALRIAGRLEDEHFVRDPMLEPSVTLTTAGEQQVMALAPGAAGSLSERLMLLRDVELACAATRVAREGHDYLIRGGEAVKLNPETGFLERGQTPTWLPPLEQSRGLAARPRRVDRHATSGMTLLWRFEHVAGASGTIINEALDYLLLIGLPPAVIPPHVPRHDGLLPDVYAADAETLNRWVTEQVAAQAASRPILVATDSILEAELLAQRLSAVVPKDCSVRAVSGKTIAEERVFERAGRPGVTIVSTRVAGRGVDIRLSPEARDAGGPLLISIGHAEEARLDRQLLGRVGRRGDRYAAQFVNHPDDPFMRRVSNRRWMSRSISWAPDQVFPSKMLTRQLTRAQRRRRLARLSGFAGDINRQQADGDAYELLRRWRTALPQSTDGPLPAACVQTIAERYLAARFPGFVQDSPDAVLATEDAAAEVAQRVGDPDGRRRLTFRTTGQPAAESREIFTAYLAEKLEEAMHANIAARERMRAEREAAERAAVELRLLRFLRAVVEEPEPPGAERMLALALAGAGGGHEVPVAAEGRQAVLRLVAQALARHPREADGGAASRTLPDLAAEVVLDGANGSPERRDQLRERVDAAFRERRATAERLDDRWRHQERRSPWAVASETIDKATQRLLAGLDRTSFELGHTTTGQTYFRMYRRRVAALCADIEATLSAEMIANLRLARDPASLDELFAEREHAVRVARPQTDGDLALPPLGPGQRRPQPRPLLAATDPGEIVGHFVEAMCERLGPKAPDTRHIYPVLNEIMLPNGSPAVLTEPDKVAEAYARYKASKARERIPPFRRRGVDRQVRLFFRFLRERGLAAPLPTGVAQRSASLARRARSTFSATGLGLGSAALLGAVVLSALLFVLPGFEASSPGPGVGLLDRILSAGSLSAGSALGPALLAIVGAAWVGWLAGVPPTSDAGQFPLERWAAMVLLVVGTVLAVRPGHGGFGPDLLVQLVDIVVVLVLGSLVRAGLWLFESMVHFHATAGLAAGFAAFAAVPFLAGLATWRDALLVGGLTAAVTLASLPLRRARLPVVAILVDPDSPEKAETLDVPLTVRAPLSIVQHASALLVAWMLSCVLIDGTPAVRATVAGVAYLLVLAGWARLLTRSATDVAAWREGMRRRQRDYAGTPAHPTLESALEAVRRRLAVLELGTALVPIAVGSVVAADLDGDVVGAVPWGVGVVAASVFAVELGRAFVNGFRLPITGAAMSSSRAVDDTESFTATAQESIRRLLKQLGIFVAVIGVLRTISDVLGVWDVIEGIADWIGRLF